MRTRLTPETLEPRRLLAFTTPVISEFLAVNDGGLRDENGDRPDWVEIHNPTSGSVSLDGYYLTDDAGNKRKWRLPAVTLASRGYLVVFASDKDRRTAGRQLHTNFQLDAGGEYLGLVKPDGTTVVSQFSPEFPEQTADVSYGLPASGTTVGEGYRFLKTPTPGAPNASQWIVHDTKFSKDRGFYSSSFTVAITTQTPGAQIRYTTNGQPPTATTGAVYTGPRSTRRPPCAPRRSRAATCPATSTRRRTFSSTTWSASPPTRCPRRVGRRAGGATSSTTGWTRRSSTAGPRTAPRCRTR